MRIEGRETVAERQESQTRKVHLCSDQIRGQNWTDVRQHRKGRLSDGENRGFEARALKGHQY